MLGCPRAFACTPVLVMETHRILVVDDDPKIRSMLSRYLGEEGFAISLAASGAEMRKALADEKVDLVLLDLLLPGEDGLLLAREIRSRADRIGIIMVTGRSDMVDTVVGLEVGADDYIAKPFHLREVLARIKSLLRRIHPSGENTLEQPAKPVGSDVTGVDRWRLDLGRRELKKPNGIEVPLTWGSSIFWLRSPSIPGVC